jgi:hypothetical protein
MLISFELAEIFCVRVYVPLIFTVSPLPCALIAEESEAYCPKFKLPSLIEMFGSIMAPSSTINVPPFTAIE